MQKSTQQIKIKPNYTHGDYLHELYPTLRKYPKEILEEPFFRMVGLREGPSYKYLLVKTAKEIEKDIFSEYTDTRIANLCEMFKHVKKEDKQIIFDSIDCLVRAVENKIKIPLIAEKGLYALAVIATGANKEIRKGVAAYISYTLKNSAPGIREFMIERLQSIDTVEDGDVKTIGSLEIVMLDARGYEAVQSQAKSEYVKILLAMRRENEEEEQRNKNANAMGPVSFSELMGIEPESISEAVILISKLNKNELMEWNAKKNLFDKKDLHLAQVQDSTPLPNVILSETLMGQLNGLEQGVEMPTPDGDANEYQAMIEEEIPITDSLITQGPENAKMPQARIIEPILEENISEVDIEPADPPEIEFVAMQAESQPEDSELITKLDEVVSINDSGVTEDSGVTGNTEPGMDDKDIEFLSSGIVEMEQDEELPITDSMVEEIPSEVYTLVKPKPRTDPGLPLVDDEIEGQIEQFREEPSQPIIEEASAPHDLRVVRQGEEERECSDSMVVSIEELKREHQEVIFASRLSEFFGYVGTAPGSGEEVIFASRFSKADSPDHAPDARDGTGYSHSKIFAIFSAPGEKIIENGNGFESLIQEDHSDREQTNIFRRKKTSVKTQDGMDIPLEMISKSVKGGEVQFAYGNLENMPDDIREMFPANSTRWVLDCDLDYPAHIQPIGSMDFGGKNVNVFDVPVPGSKSLTSINRRIDFTKDGEILSIRQIGSINSEDSILELLTDIIIKKE